MAYNQIYQKMNRKHKVNYDQKTINDIKEGNRILVDKIIHVKPIVNTQNTKPKAQPHVHANIKGHLIKERKLTYQPNTALIDNLLFRRGTNHPEEE